MKLILLVSMVSEGMIPQMKDADSASQGSFPMQG